MSKSNDEDPPELPFGITEAWWREGLRLLRADDVSRLVTQMTKKRRLQAEKLARERRASVEYDHKSQSEDVKESIEDHYAKQTLRPRVLDSIAVAYWENLLDVLASRGIFDKSSKVVEIGIGRRLGMDKGTLSRWKSGKSQADDRRFLGAVVVVMRTELDRVGLERRSEIIWRAVQRTLELVLARELLPGLRTRRENGEDVVLPAFRADGLTPEARLSPEDYRLICSVVGDSSFDSLVGPPTLTAGRRFAAVHPKSFARLIGTRYGMHAMQPTEVGAKRTELSLLIDTWARPYVLFRIGLSQGWDTNSVGFADYWEDLHDEAIRGA